MNVVLQARGEVCIECDGGAALVLAEFGENLMRERDGEAQRRECSGDGLLVRGVGEGEEERDGDGFGIRFTDVAAELVECCMGWRAENSSVGANAFGNAEAKVGDGRGAMVVPIVEIGAGLAGDGEGVFKSSSGDEGDACAFALEQSVGGDGGAVANFYGGGCDEVRDFVDGFEDGAAGIVWRRREFEHTDAIADAVDAVSEGAAGVDGDGEVRGHSRKHIRLGDSVVDEKAWR